MLQGLLASPAPGCPHLYPNFSPSCCLGSRIALVPGHSGTIIKSECSADLPEGNDMTDSIEATMQEFAARLGLLEKITSDLLLTNLYHADDPAAAFDDMREKVIHSLRQSSARALALEVRLVPTARWKDAGYAAAPEIAKSTCSL